MIRELQAQGFEGEELVDQVAARLGVDRDMARFYISLVNGETDGDLVVVDKPPEA